MGKKSGMDKFIRPITKDALKRHDTDAGQINPVIIYHRFHHHGSWIILCLKYMSQPLLFQENVKTKFHQVKLENKKKKFMERTQETARAEILNYEEEG